jgi:hypothetical protein
MQLYHVNGYDFTVYQIPGETWIAIILNQLNSTASHVTKSINLTTYLVKSFGVDNVLTGPHKQYWAIRFDQSDFDHQTDPNIAIMASSFTDFHQIIVATLNQFSG